MQHSADGVRQRRLPGESDILEEKERASTSQSNGRLRFREGKAFQEEGTEYI